MATKKEKIRAWLIKREKIIDELSQNLLIVYDDVDCCWRFRLDDGTWPKVEESRYLNPGFRRLVAERNYYLGAKDLCSACGIEY